MEFTFLQGCLLFFAAMMAGALNSVAGGGSFISFPALNLFGGVPEKFANTTNTVALWPGSVASVGAYRKELMTQRKGLVLLSSVSLIGGGLGAILLLGTPQVLFTKMVPFLMLFATLLFAFGRRMSNALRARAAHVTVPVGVTAAGVVLLQFITAIYGGFFGGGIGIMMLAILSLWGMDNIHNMNALKTALASLINGVAVLSAFMSWILSMPHSDRIASIIMPMPPPKNPP